MKEQLIQILLIVPFSFFWIWGFQSVTRQGMLLEFLSMESGSLISRKVLGINNKFLTTLLILVEKPWSECKTCMSSLHTFFWIASLYFGLWDSLFFWSLVLPVVVAGLTSVICHVSEKNYESIVDAIEQIS